MSTPSGTPSDGPPPDLVTIDPERGLWDRVFTVAPLVVVGTKEGDGYDLAPKHLAMPLSWQNHFGFVCTEAHATYRNARDAGCFTVSFPRPSQAVITSLTAAPRCGGPEGDKPVLSTLPTFPARTVDGIFLQDAYLYLECELERIVDGFGDNSLVAGRVVAAHVDEAGLRTAERADQDALSASSPTVYLSPGRYASVGESQAFPFPADFRR